MLATDFCGCKFWCLLQAISVHSPSDRLDDERLLVQKCAEGDPTALARVREQFHTTLFNILLSRGASRTETEDLLADLWVDCVPGDSERPSLLEKFSGRCSLQGWLATVATRRWIDLKRKVARRMDLNQTADSSEDAIERLPASPLEGTEDSLVQLLRESLQAAFAICPPESMVLLRLVYLHGLTQRELVRLLRWNESKMSRVLSEAMSQIERNTLRELKKRDPLLELNWQDFLDLCETEQVGFL
jgi:RNA polymerase sigma factor (sigma-70 family)